MAEQQTVQVKQGKVVTPLEPKESCLRRYKVKMRGCLQKARGGSVSIVLVVGMLVVIALSHARSSTIDKVCNAESDEILLRELSAQNDNNNIDTTEMFAPPERKLPHCIILGVRKTGTRALVKFLSINPEIVPVSKELHFFDQPKKYIKGLKLYHESMPYSFKGQLTVEKTAAYFTDPNAPERIHNTNSSMKLMIMVREPVLRLVSEYSQTQQAGIKNNKPVKPFEEEVLGEDGEINKFYRPIMTSTYHIAMTRWLKHFPLTQIHIIDGDIFERDPYSEIYKIEKFLGVGHLIKRENFFLNETRGFFCINGGGPITPCLQNIGRSSYPEVAPDLVRKLFKYFRPHNRHFFQLINRNFTWDSPDEFIKTQRKFKHSSN